MQKLLIIVGLLLVATPVSAAKFVSQENGTYAVPTGSTLNEDLYAAGDKVSVDGTVQGDVTAAGRTIAVTGVVDEDLSVAGQDIKVVGSVGQDMRAAGQTIEIDGTVHGDIIVFGETLTIRSSGIVDGDVLFFGSKLTIEGEVKGEVRVWGASFEMNKGKSGKIVAHAESVALTGAYVNGDFSYSSSNDARVDSSTVITGKTEKMPQPLKGDAPLVRWSPFNIGTLLMALAATAIAIALFPNAVSTNVMAGTQRPVKTLLIGLAGVIVAPIVAFVLLFTVVGLPIGFLILLLYGAAVIVAKVLSGILVGAVLAKLIKKEYKITYLWAGAGVLFLVVVPIIPFIGWIPGVLAFLVMFGVLTRNLEKVTSMGRSDSAI